jgi:hypothetical protein
MGEEMKKKTQFYLITSFLFIAAFSGCESYDSYATNPSTGNWNSGGGHSH